jgi:uncharacterized protein (TIGR03435 family)
MKRACQAAVMLLGILVVPPRVPAQSAALDAQTASQPAQPGSASERPAFEVASIKVNHSGADFVITRPVPGRYAATNITARMLINFAYNVKSAQVSGGPSWISTDRFDIDAKEEDSIAQQLQKMSRDQANDQIRLMVQSLLADRFGLVVSRPTKEMPIYALVVARGGAKLAESALPPLPKGFSTGPAQMPSAPPTKPSDVPQGAMMQGPGHLLANGVSVAALASMLSAQPEFSDRVMVDQTGLTGKYDMLLQWTPENLGPMMNPNEPAPDPNAPSLFAALEEQLGLHVESTKGPVEMLVIEQISEPSEN